MSCSSAVNISPQRTLCGTAFEAAYKGASLVRRMPPKNRRTPRVPRWGKNFLRWRIRPVWRKLGIPDRLVTFQVMRRSLGTNLQEHGTLKDAQGRAPSCQHHDDRQRLHAGRRRERDACGQLTRYRSARWLDAGGGEPRSKWSEHQEAACTHREYSSLRAQFDAAVGEEVCM